MKNKDIVFESAIVFLMTALFVIACIGTVRAVDNQQEARCSCLASQPYINAKYHGGRCLVNVTSYEDIDITKTIFIAQEFCR